MRGDEGGRGRSREREGKRGKEREREGKRGEMKKNDWNTKAKHQKWKMREN